MVLHHDVLKSILCHPDVENLPIAVISVVGAYRTGKSFLLNYILRYFQNHGYKCPSWMGAEDEKLVGFDWGGGMDSKTAGIWMWNEPFTVEKGGEEVAVFLVDCQGHFDADSDELRSKMSVVTSLLLSSVTILNISERMNKTDIDFLELCIAYSERTYEGNLACPLQDLFIVIRNWNYPDDLPYGETSDKECIQQKILKKNTDVEKAFRQVKCYLMPEPSDVTRKGKCSGEPAKIDSTDGFVERLKDFCERAANPGNLSLKGNFTGHSLMTLVITNFDVMLKNSNPILEAKTIAELAQDVESDEYFYNSAAEIGRRLDQIVSSGDVNDEHLKNKYDEICDEIFGKFRTDIQFLGPKGVKRRAKQLKKYVYTRHFKRAVLANGVAKMINRNAGENALHLIAAFKLQMEKAMVNVGSEEWRSKFDSSQKENSLVAVEAFKQFSKDSMYQAGLKMLCSGINCVTGLMNMEGSLKEEFTNYEVKKMVCDSADEYETFHSEAAGQPEVDGDTFISQLRREVQDFEYKRRVFDDITTFSKNIKDAVQEENLDKKLEKMKIDDKSKTHRSLGDFGIKVVEIYKLLEDKVRCWKVTPVRLVKSAVELISRYKDEMARAMKGISSYEWSILESSHMKNLDKALKSFREYSMDAEFEKGHRFLICGLRCERALIALERILSKDVAGYQRKKTVCHFFDDFAKNMKRRAKARPVQFKDVIDQIRREVKQFELKQKLVQEINTYSKQVLHVLHGKDLDRKLNLMKKDYGEQAEPLEDISGSKFVDEIGQMIEQAFQLFRQRDEDFKPFRLRLLKLDKAVRESAYVTAITRQLDDGYATPEVFDQIHNDSVNVLLPQTPTDCSPDALKHKEEVRKALNEHRSDFEKWNEENKSIFKRRVGLSAGGMGALGAGGAVGGAIAIYLADVAVITTAGAAAGAGVGAAVGVVAAFVLGGVLVYKFIRKRAQKKRLELQKQSVVDEAEHAFDDGNEDEQE